MRINNVEPRAFVAQLSCDRCGAEARYNVGDGFNNFLQLGFDASWGSAFGDGNRVDVDICHGCLKETLGPWLRVSSSVWARHAEKTGFDEAGASRSSKPER